MPSDKSPINIFPIDLANNPKRIVLNGFELPQDSVIRWDAEKVIAESQILDGVSVYERIARKPYVIDLYCTFRQKNDSTIAGAPQYLFPQDLIDEFIKQAWVPNQLLTIENTLLNSIGITEVVFIKHSVDTIRGSLNVPVTINLKENYTPTGTQGQTLII